MVSGLLSTCLYSTVALAYFLIIRATRLVNFAIGGYAVFAGLLLANVVTSGWPLLVAIPVALIAVALLAFLTDRLVVNVMERRESRPVTIEIAIVALLFVLEQAAGLLFGRQPTLGKPWVGGSWKVGDAVVAWQSVFTMVATVMLFALVASWLKRGRYGRMLRAVGDNPGAAQVLGLPIGTVRAVAWGMAGLVAGVAGLLASAQASLSIESGTTFTLLGFVALVLGGSANAWAPLVGGLVLGLIEAFSIRLVGNDVRDYVFLALVLIVFTFRPRGIFAVKERT